MSNKCTVDKVKRSACARGSCAVWMVVFLSWTGEPHRWDLQSASSSRLPLTWAPPCALSGEALSSAFAEFHILNRITSPRRKGTTTTENKGIVFKYTSAPGPRSYRMPQAFLQGTPWAGELSGDRRTDVGLTTRTVVLSSCPCTASLAEPCRRQRAGPPTPRVRLCHPPRGLL